MKTLAWLMFFSLLIACSHSESDSFAQNRGERHNPQSKSSNVNTVAEAEYKKIFESIFTQCGDSYYAERTLIERTKGVSAITGERPRETKTVEIFRLKGVSFTVINHPLDEVNKLNGFQWRGIVQTSYVAARTYEENKGWSDWKRQVVISNFGPVFCCELRGEKKNSSWWFGKTFDYEADNNYFFVSAKFRKINCATIPD